MDSNYAEENNAFIYAMNHLLGPVYTAVLKVAVELDLFEIIAKASPVGVTASDVASELPTQHPELRRRLDRMLCLLASNSFLTCSTRTNEDSQTERLYQLSPVGQYFVKDENKGSLAFLSTLISHRAYVDVLYVRYLIIWSCKIEMFINEVTPVNSFEGLYVYSVMIIGPECCVVCFVSLSFKEILCDFDKGISEKVHGMSFYEGMADPMLNNIFNKAMANLGIIEMKKILETYTGFEEISSLVDVGGGIGQNLNMIISKYPSIKGINFDLPRVIQNAPIYPGIQHFEGDMFESVPKGDAILLKAILHNWSDEKCTKILTNCYKALPENGKVIVVDFIMPEAVHFTEVNKMITGMDNLMYVVDGIERTEKEFENLCQRRSRSSIWCQNSRDSNARCQNPSDYGA
ncbi:hypothetical protein Fmac_011563 [Flemingia macrophylla]|uniref:Uncharacterized protein n=1 Tax=Flemingia macrophylla TaxID=520843 RepID=A0ABD1MMU0_9FABA